MAGSADGRIDDRVNNNGEMMKRGRRRKRDEQPSDDDESVQDDEMDDDVDDEADNNDVDDEDDAPARIKKQARERDVLLATSAALMNQVALSTDKALIGLPGHGNAGQQGAAFPYAATLANANVTLDALQSTKMAIAQFAATAMSSKESQSPAAMQELAVLQSTLIALQQQQMMQLQLIQQLQQQLQINNQAEAAGQGAATGLPAREMGGAGGGGGGMASLMNFMASHATSAGHTDGPDAEGGSSENSSRTSTPARPLHPSESGRPSLIPATTPHSPKPSSKDARRSRLHLDDPVASAKQPTPATTSSSNATSTATTAPATSSSSYLQSSGSSTYAPGTFNTASLMSQLPSGSLADAILQTSEPPPNPEGPSTLDLLQRTAQNVLNNASQGLLATNLADELGFRNGMGGNGHSGGSSGGPNGDGGSGSGSGGKKDALFKHRCRYCGKVFSSDSALQIHIRSHTGERPFKCNICGNRFTTKGNLKVHFQRHAQRFPHIKMNPHPVPEHLDKFHPPLLAQLDMDESKMSPPPPPPPPPPPSAPHHHHGFHPPTSTHQQPHPAQSSSLFRSTAGGNPVVPVSNSFLFRPQALSDLMPPAGLRPIFPPSLMMPPMPGSHRGDAPSSAPEEEHHEAANKQSDNSDDEDSRDMPSAPEESKADAVRIKMERADDPEDEDDDQRRRPSSSADSASPKDEAKSKDDQGGRPDSRMFSDRSASASPASRGDASSGHDKTADQDDRDLVSSKEAAGKQLNDEGAENLSGRRSATCSSPGSPRPGHPGLDRSLLFPHPMGGGGPGGLRFPFPPPGPPPPPGGLMLLPTDVDPAKDPAIYTNLLPRPGSNDNAWESLIEVTRTSDTAKLQQLVDNIENKLVDPNQCVVCHRVLSCKSALQMHYRTHTGERPFKCKICGRAFTTKGNLKTHMGVHRAKPPARLLHICPVCHKKFTNGLVLQQHIRLHTGEPTDLTPEQIQAAELRDPFPGHPGFPFLPAGFHPFHPFMHHHGFHLPPGGPFGLGPGEGKDAGGEGRDGDAEMPGDAEMGGSSSEALSPTSSTASSQLHHHGLLQLQHQLQTRLASGQPLTDEERQQLIMAQISRANAEFFRKYQQDFADQDLMDDDDDDVDGDEDGEDEEDTSLMANDEMDSSPGDCDNSPRTPNHNQMAAIKSEKLSQSDDSSQPPRPVGRHQFDFSPARASTPGDGRGFTKSSPATSRPSSTNVVSTLMASGIPAGPVGLSGSSSSLPATLGLKGSVLSSIAAAAAAAAAAAGHPPLSPLDLTATRGVAPFIPSAVASSSSSGPTFPGFGILPPPGGPQQQQQQPSSAAAAQPSQSAPTTAPTTAATTSTAPTSALSSLTSAVMASPSFNPLNLPISAPGKTLSCPSQRAVLFPLEFSWWKSAPNGPVGGLSPFASRPFRPW